MTFRRLAVLACAFASALAGVACASGANPAAPSSSVVAISISGANRLTAIGQRTTLMAVANRSDATTSVLTTAVSWQSSDASIVTVSGGTVTAAGVGSAVVTASYQGLVATLNVTVVLQADCAAYDASGWRIVEEANGFLLAGFIAGIDARVFTFDTRADAQNGLAVFQRFATFCFVGRDNARANRLDYIWPYWTDTTMRTTAVAPEDCEPYNASTLATANLGASGWALTASGRQLLLLDTENDAKTMLMMAQRFNSQCFIGRGNARSNPRSYILTYWK